MTGTFNLTYINIFFRVILIVSDRFTVHQPYKTIITI